MEARARAQISEQENHSEVCHSVGDYFLCRFTKRYLSSERYDPLFLNHSFRALEYTLNCPLRGQSMSENGRLGPAILPALIRRVERAKLIDLKRKRSEKAHFNSGVTVT
ncbi:hypothetical protein EVAR_100610_1 [Eumeta japonica]|uniref:Uncharacterized protein n=1 Tax=Eumeta variegata TaxID=151549 RepID=A0A4C1Z7N7_EUMVA|nr:hypothetical protein EVAR_100610_1 [Eumeta japonica]